MRLVALALMATCVSCGPGVETSGGGQTDKSAKDVGAEKAPADKEAVKTAPEVKKDDAPETKEPTASEVDVLTLKTQLMGSWHLGILKATYAADSMTFGALSAPTITKISEYTSNNGHLGIVLADGRRCEFILENANSHIAACAPDAWPAAGWERLTPANRYTRDGT